MAPPPAFEHRESSLFRSFWMGGFEGADHRNRFRVALDMVRATGHTARVDQDLRQCARMGLLTVRESVGWRQSEIRPGRFDLTRALSIAKAARRQRVQVLWSLMHYGVPDDLHAFHPDFVARFADFAWAVAKALKPFADDDHPTVYTPINEIGFLAWAWAETDDFGGRPPSLAAARSSTLESGYVLKLKLVEAAIAGCKAIREIDPLARFMHVEPVVHVVAPVGRPELDPLAREVASYQWQVWDLLAGLDEPGLGGDPAWLDILGINHYHNGQWEVGTERRLHWDLPDPRRKSFASLALPAWERYRRPMIVAETSHVGLYRERWFEEMAAEAERLRHMNVPLEGLCLYPIVDRPDWNEPTHWHNSGLWDAAPPGSILARGVEPGRLLCRPYAMALRRWQQRLPERACTPHTNERSSTMNAPLIVFSHLRWDFVYQRPQHLLSRIAHRHPVIFIEEPMFEEGEPRLECRNPCDGVLVVRPLTDVQAPGFHDDQIKVLKPLLSQLLQEQALEDYVVWFYTPMALPLLAELQPKAVVYDCMDELAAFRAAPRQMRQRESALLKRADLVLCGGPSLYQSKRGLNDNVHCLPSCVDAAHYAPERITAKCEHYLAAEQLQSHILAPRLGYFGVIDERLDIELIAGIADARPDWHVVMVGPVAKIDAAQLPQRPNIHWLGPQPYARLPALVAGWDVCLLPFALNEHTRFISPTKTLEYLASEKPVVSTPVNDVVSMYGDSVTIAARHDAFIGACDAAMKETPEQRADRLAHSAATVSRFSWDEAARKVVGLMAEAVERAAERVQYADGFPAADMAALLPSVALATGEATAMEEDDIPQAAAAAVAANNSNPVLLAAARVTAAYAAKAARAAQALR